MRENQTRILDRVEYTAPIEVERSKIKGRATSTATLEALRAYEHAVALQIIERQAMGPEACSFLRGQLEQTSDVLYKAFGVDRKTFYRWSKGHSAMPRPVWIVLARIILERDEGRSDTLNLLLDCRSHAA